MEVLSNSFLRGMELTEILLYLFLGIGGWVVIINQIYGWMEGRASAMLAIPKEINNIGRNYLGYDMIFDGNAWKEDVSFITRLSISLFAITKFMIWPFGVDIDE